MIYVLINSSGGANGAVGMGKNNFAGIGLFVN